jgi:hypothetical protein
MPDNAARFPVSQSPQPSSQQSSNQQILADDDFKKRLDTAIESSKQIKRLPTFRDLIKDLQEIRNGTSSSEPAESTSH